ncbi:MAG: MBL fold metallo-hydrolase [Verrucomicrobiales bacterium]
MKTIHAALSLSLGFSVSAADDLPSSLLFQTGPVNAVSIVRDGGQLAVNRGVRPSPERLLLTHGRRDVVRFARDSSPGEVSAPAASREFLENTAERWNAWWDQRFDYYGQQVTQLPVRDFPASDYLEDGASFQWRGLEFRYLDTPGYTRDGGTYFVTLDGTKVAFTGDLVLEGGKVADLYSFQNEIPAAKIGGYHGHLGRLATWLRSLEAVAAERPDLIVPSRGGVIRDPAADLGTAMGKAREIYRNYLSTNALHWYFGEERMNICAERVLGAGETADGMPFAEHVDLPDWCRHIGTTKLLVSDSGRGFVLDVGSAKALETLKSVVADGLVEGIDGIFATHTHNDHTAGIADAAAAFDCPVYALPEVADVLEHPGNWFLPGVSPNAVETVTVKRNGDRMNWEEFALTFHFYPGQMYNHGALLVEKPDHDPVFFMGDSFSPSGIDDYCLMNRNLMREDTGYELCFRKLDRLPENAWLVNQHIPHLFRFSEKEKTFLLSTYRERGRLIADFVAWDDINYAIDEQWTSFYPYGQEADSGDALSTEVHVWNHPGVERTFTVRLGGDLSEGSEPASLTLAAGETGSVEFPIAIPSDADSGVHVITADIAREDGVECLARSETLIRIR